MITPSPLLREATKYSHTLNTVVDVYSNGALLKQNVPVVDGTLTGDRSQKARLNCDLSLALPTWEATGIDCYSCRFQVRRGVASMGVDETTVLGWFRVDDISRNDYGELAINGSGLENYIVDARFIRPRTPPRGSDTVGTIVQLIREVLPNAGVRAFNTYNRLVTAIAPWERERWDAIEYLADSIFAEVFVDHSGDFVIADVPTITGGVPVMWFDEGDGGLLINRKEKSTREQVYNAVSAGGMSTDPNVPPVWAAAYDLDPTSKTYWHGPFGQVPRFYTNQYFSTVEQCQATADELLIQSLAAYDSLEFDSLPLDYLEVGDLAGVRRSDGSATTHLVQATTSHLGTSGGLACKTLSSKTVARDDL